MRTGRAGITAIAVALLVSGCAAGSEELRRENEELRRMVLSTRTDLEDMRRDQDRLRAAVENLQHGRSGSAPTALAPAAAPQAAEDGQAPEQRWPADPWGSPDAFGVGGTPRDLNTLQPGQAVSPTGEPVSAPSMGAPAAPTVGIAPQAGSIPQAPPAAGADLGAATAAPPPPGAVPQAVGERPPGQEIVASVHGSGSGKEPPMVSAAPMPALTVPDSLAGSLYDKGVNAFNEGRYDDAIQSFRDFVHQQPQSAYADDAQYWIGESNLRKGQYNNAIKEFNQVVLRYASGDRSAPALLKLAEVFSKMNDQVDARLSLQKLVNRYPGSAEAAQAYKMLQEMGG